MTLGVAREPALLGRPAPAAAATRDVNAEPLHDWGRAQTRHVAGASGVGTGRAPCPSELWRELATCARLSVCLGPGGARAVGGMEQRCGWDGAAPLARKASTSRPLRGLAEGFLGIASAAQRGHRTEPPGGPGVAQGCSRAAPGGAELREPAPCGTFGSVAAGAGMQVCYKLRNSNTHDTIPQKMWRTAAKW